MAIPQRHGPMRQDGFVASVFAMNPHDAVMVSHASPCLARHAGVAAAITERIGITAGAVSLLRHRDGRPLLWRLAPMAEFDAWYVFGVDRVVNRLQWAA